MMLTRNSIRVLMVLCVLTLAGCASVKEAVWELNNGPFVEEHDRSAHGGVI
jgi:hypothetical protein